MLLCKLTNIFICSRVAHTFTNNFLLLRSTLEKYCTYLFTHTAVLFTFVTQRVMRLFLYTVLLRSASCYVSNVALRAVSPLLKQTEMTTILAGQRNIECVLSEARRIKKESGISASHEFLDEVPELYIWQTRQLRQILLDNAASIKQVVILQAHMNTMAYEMPCLRDCNVIEIADKATIHVKEQLIQQHGSHIPHFAKSITRISDAHSIDWTQPTAVLMPEHYEPIPRRLSKGSAIVCTSNKLLDVKNFNRVVVRRRRKVTQIAASRYLES